MVDTPDTPDTSDRSDTSETREATETTSNPVHTYTLSQLSGLLGSATEADRALFAVTESPQTLREIGRTIASSRILTDGERWLGQVYTFQKDMPAQTQPIPAALVRVIVAELQKLSTYQADIAGDGAGQRQLQAVAIVQAREARDALLADRQTLYMFLQMAARNDATLLAASDSAYGTVDTSLALQVSMQQQIQLARSWLADGSLMGRRLRALQLTDAELSRMETAANGYVELQDRADGARAALPVTQTDVDIQDGVCVVLLTELYRLSKTLRLRNPLVPVLQPIALRFLFSR